MYTITFTESETGEKDTLASFTIKELDLIQRALEIRIWTFQRWADETNNDDERNYWAEEIHRGNELYNQLAQLRWIRSKEEASDLPF